MTIFSSKCFEILKYMLFFSLYALNYGSTYIISLYGFGEHLIKFSFHNHSLYIDGTVIIDLQDKNFLHVSVYYIQR